jgi:hypothetical protein
MSCPGNHCTMKCSGTGSCELSECTEGCTLTCNTVGSCEQT